jgi:hypothetical protein
MEHVMQIPQRLMDHLIKVLFVIVEAPTFFFHAAIIVAGILGGVFFVLVTAGLLAFLIRSKRNGSNKEDHEQEPLIGNQEERGEHFHPSGNATAYLSDIKLVKKIGT